MNKKLLAILLLALILSSVNVAPMAALPTFLSPVNKIYFPIIIMPRAHFFAWAQAWDSRIPMQLMTLDARQERQYTCSAQDAADFAANHPGNLYIACDEPDIHIDTWATPADYAVWYHDFTAHVKAADPTARFSPAGFALTSPGLHFTDYAQQFYDEYVALYGVPPGVDEWRFHAFICDEGNLPYWKQKVTEAAAWSEAHDAPMTLGSFGMPCETQPADITDIMWQMHDYIVADSRIVAAAWWSADWTQWSHALKSLEGDLTPEGLIYSQWE